jgi:hypothetical protein
MTAVEPVGLTDPGHVLRVDLRSALFLSASEHSDPVFRTQWAITVPRCSLLNTLASVIAPSSSS